MDELKTNIEETKKWLVKELSGVRTGRAAPQLLENVRVEAYGVATPLSQVATVGVEDAKTLVVSPWDKDHIKGIEKAISDADLGVSTQAGDVSVRVMFPDLTQERRDMLLKLVGDRLEQAKVTLRGARNEAIDVYEKQEKDGEISEDALFKAKEDIQKLIEAGTKELEALAEKKREEVKS
ncbi:MAG: ribosome recycling factor [Patescibacteria group bacterium UBA2103]